MKLAFALSHSTLLLSLLWLAGCGGTTRPPARGPETAAEALAWFEALDARYEVFRRPLEASRWRAAMGAPPIDVAEPRRLEADFFSDAEVDLRLAKLSAHKAPAIAELARDWQRLRQRHGLLESPGILQIQQQLRHATHGRPGTLDGHRAQDILLHGQDPQARRDALTALARSTAGVLPLLIERARRLDRVAQNRGARDYPALSTGLPLKSAMEGLEQQCSLNIGQSRLTWLAFLERGKQTLGRRPDEADFAALAISALEASDDFLRHDRVARALSKTLNTMGLERQPLKIQAPKRGDARGVFAIAPPEDVRLVGRYGDGYLESLRWLEAAFHAAHLSAIDDRHQPRRRRPQQAALAQGIALAFASLLSDEGWLKAAFPELTPAQLQRFLEATAAYDAWALRQHCLVARLELEAHTGRDLVLRYPHIFDESFGQTPKAPPTWMPLSVLERPLSAWGQVLAGHIRDLTLGRLEGRPLDTSDAGRWLRVTVLSKGNRLRLTDVLDPKGIPTLTRWLSAEPPRPTDDP